MISLVIYYLTSQLVLIRTLQDLMTRVGIGQADLADDCITDQQPCNNHQGRIQDFSKGGSQANGYMYKLYYIILQLFTLLF